MVKLLFFAFALYLYASSIAFSKKSSRTRRIILSRNQASTFLKPRERRSCEKPATREEQKELREGLKAECCPGSCTSEELSEWSEEFCWHQVDQYLCELSITKGIECDCIGQSWFDMKEYLETHSFIGSTHTVNGECMVYPTSPCQVKECDCTGFKKRPGWKFQTIAYDFDKQEAIRSKPLYLNKMVLDNRNSGGGAANFQPTTTFRVTTTEYESFINSFGSEIKLSLEAEIGIPLVANLKSSSSFTQNFKHEKMTSKTKTKETAYECQARINKKITCTVTGRRQTMSIPFTMVMKNSKFGCVCASRGIFKKVQLSTLNMTITADD